VRCRIRANGYGGGDAAAAVVPDESVSYPACKDDRPKVVRSAMIWCVLVLSGLLESVWALALSRSAGFTRLVPSLIFAVGLALSMAGLGYALRTLPVGTAYAVWVGIGVTGTAVAGILCYGEGASLPRLVSLLLVVAGVIGLKLFH
jgi:quaternary ammonium compound-resistance protein SugE